MPTLTREEAKNALRHVLVSVFGYDKDCNLAKALDRYAGRTANILDVINMRNDDIDNLAYPGENDQITEFAHGDRGLIRMIKSYHTSRKDAGDPIGKDWVKVTREMFDHYRTEDYSHRTADRGSTLKPDKSGGAPTLVHDPTYIFKRGIKRDPSFFPELKDDKQWDSWQRSTTALADSQDVQEVLDSSYTPSTKEDESLFVEKQKYMYFVFDRNLKTDKGKALVRQHEVDRDAQAIYRALCEHASKSTKAALDASDILSYITSARLGDGSWKGTTHGLHPALAGPSPPLREAG